MLPRLFHIETLTGQPLNLNGVQLRLRSQVLQIRLPTANVGLIWNRPIAVVLSRPDGQEQILPIRDVTRTAVLALLAFSVGSIFILMLFRRKTT